MASIIGIKIANGEFYSITEENSRVKKRLVLTTVHDNQQSVQIDLYKSSARTMADALYIGSMVLDNIKPRPKGEPSIELVISSTEDGNISADAVDMDTSIKGEHHTLDISIKSLEEEHEEYEIPDFELEHNEPPPRGLYEKATTAREDEEEKRKFPWLVVICAALILTAIGLAIWFFLFRSVPETAASRPATVVQSAPQPEAQPEPPPPAPVVQEQPAPVVQAAPPPTQVVQPPPPVIQAPAAPPKASAASRQRTPPPVASYAVPSVIPKEGAPYRIRWGDTLWDIAEAFYRNPWLYPRIARFNNIRNPDLIISGTTIRVPPRN